MLTLCSCPVASPPRDWPVLPEVLLFNQRGAEKQAASPPNVSLSFGCPVTGGDCPLVLCGGGADGWGSSGGPWGRGTPRARSPKSLVNLSLCSSSWAELEGPFQWLHWFSVRIFFQSMTCNIAIVVDSLQRARGPYQVSTWNVEKTPGA